MGKNMIRDVAKALGVEIGERFTISYSIGADQNCSYFFDGAQLMAETTAGAERADGMLRELLNGTATVVKRETVDAVPVVRCVNCKYFLNDELVEAWCIHPNGLNGAHIDGFCSYGKPL